MTSPTVSIITPILARPKFHELLADFVARQTYPVHEHIVVEERWSYDAHGKPIANATYVLPDEQHVTIGEKLNLAHSAAKGDILISFSSDDYFETDYVARHIEVLTRNPHLAVTGFSTMRFYDLLRKRWIVFRKGNNGGNYGYHRRFFRTGPFPALDYGEDSGFFKSVPRDRLSVTDYFESAFIAIRHSQGVPAEEGGHAWSAKHGAPDYQELIFKKWVKNELARDLYRRIQREAGVQ